MQLLAPKYDVVFHALFREDTKDKLGKMLSAILNREVKVLTIDKDRHVNIEQFDSKFGIMDIRAQLDNYEQCNIEIQLAPYPGMIKRMLYYWSDNYSRQLKKNMPYSALNKTISILISARDLNETSELEGFEVSWEIRNTKKPNIKLTDVLQLYIIEIEKIRKLFKNEPHNSLYQWIMFLDDPNSKEVANIMEQNEDISAIKNDLERISGNEELQELERIRWRQEHDYIYIRDYQIEKFRKEERARAKIEVKDEVKAEVKAEIEAEVKAEIEAEVKAKVKAEIEAEVKAQTNSTTEKIVRNMLKEGLTIEQIANISKLTPEQIEKLK